MHMANLFAHKRGALLTIVASGTLSESVGEGATVALEVKWGLITLIRQTVDLCDELKNVDMKCPLEKGPMTLKKEVQLPKAIPPVSSEERLHSQPSLKLTNTQQGSYSVLADVYTKDQKKVTCLKAENIQFNF